MEFPSGVYEFESGHVASTNGYPPLPVIWMYTAVDTVCDPLRCGSWRSYVDVAPDSWLSEQFRVPSFTAWSVPGLTYSDFRDQELARQRQGDDESWLTFGALYRYAFETSSTDLGNLTTPAALTTLFVLIILLRQVKAFLLPLSCEFGRKAAQRAHGEEWLKSNQERIAKFGEYVFRLLFHSSAAIYGIYCFGDSIWWQPGLTDTVFKGYPEHAITPSMAWYYLIQAAYNADAFISLMELSFDCKIQPIYRDQSDDETASSWQVPFAIGWSATVRGDFREMLIHHVVTNVLVIGSSAMSFTRVGSMVFLVHDISDVPVDLSKLANFLKWKVATVACFCTLLLTWMYTRLYVFPFIIFKSVLLDSYHVMATTVVPPVAFLCYYKVFCFFLALLVALNYFWFTMLVKILYTLVAKRKIVDYAVRETEEADAQDVRAPGLEATASFENCSNDGDESE